MNAIPRVSKSAIVFGPNASGKTNLLIALATMRDLILHSTAFSDAQFSEMHTPFRFGPSAERPTEFELDVLIDRIRYRYAIAYDSQRICAERLLVYRTGKSQRWFERSFAADSQKEEWAPFSPNFNGPREMWRKATRSKALFLTTAARLNSEQLAPLLFWVEHRFEVLFPPDTADLSSIAMHIQNEDFKARVLGLMHAADFRVADIRVTEQELTQGEPAAVRPAAAGRPNTGLRSSIECLYTREGWLPVWLDSIFESAGTRRLIALFGPLLSAIDHGKLLLIDEFDTSLHPVIARFLIQLINDPAVATRGTQLLVSTHNTTLMDLDILRRDEIWLVQLNKDYASNLEPLLRSSPRKHELIAKSYLRGRYGAVPVVRPELREAAARTAKSDAPAHRAARQLAS